jgi:two-component system OmpR family response regulator
VEVKALIIDDDPDILDVVSLCIELRWPGAIVLGAADGAAGLATFERESPDFVVLDLGLPDMDGLEVCARLRQRYSTPIIMLSVRDQFIDIARGLETGADDYVTKPFDQMELMARIQSVLRRRPEPQSSQPLVKAVHA